MSIIGLGYVGFGVSDLAAWAHFSSQVLGCEVSRSDHGLWLRVDSRAWRIAVQPSGEDDLIFIGWEVAGPAQLENIINRLAAHQVPVTRDDGTLARQRRVMDVASFIDPTGMRCEVFWGASEQFEKPLTSPVGVSGFVTGDQGLGHVSLVTADPSGAVAFYRDVLGFALSDHIDMPFGPAGQVLPISFMHCNPRHHTLAFAPAPSTKKLLHFMLQVASLDDVGYALDRVHRQQVPLSISLGRHTNDHMISFYCLSPSGLEIEYGCGARTVDPASWIPVRHDCISMWGHQFLGVPGTIEA